MEQDIPNDDEIVQAYVNEQQEISKSKIKDVNDDEEGKMKQEYLKINVYEVYKQEKDILDQFLRYFLTYLNQKKNIQTDQYRLQLLSLQELKELVTNFQNFIRKTIIIEPYEEQVELQIKVNELKPEYFQAQKIYYSNGAWDYQITGYEECTYIKPFFDIKDTQNCNLDITFLKSFTKKSGGFFGFGGTLQLWIQIKSKLNDIPVERRVQDFIFLKQVLGKCYPYTFVPSLQITDKQLDRVDQINVQQGIFKECKKFIDTICKNQQFLQNLFTFRFFKETKYQNYKNHKKNSQKIIINHIKMIKNTKGLVQIQISDKGQLKKRDYSKKADLFGKLWKNVEESNNKICDKLKQIESQIAKQKKQFDGIISEISQYNVTIQSQSYQDMLNVIFFYEDIFQIYSKNINQYKNTFALVNSQVASNAVKQWRSFSKYSQNINQINHEYQVRRKVFLEKQQKRKEGTVEPTGTSKTQQKNKQENNQINKANLSIISQYGVQNNCSRQVAWIERFSKWQAYMNNQYTTSFQRQLSIDIEALSQIMKKNTQQILQCHAMQEKSLISNISMIG